MEANRKHSKGLSEQDWQDLDSLGSNFKTKIRYENVDGRLLVTGLRIEALEGGITSSQLRKIRLGDLRERAEALIESAAPSGRD